MRRAATNFFKGRLLSAADLRAEQQALRERLDLLESTLAVVGGLDVPAEHRHGERLVEDESQVVVDFVLERGLLFVSVANVGATPVRGVRVDFEPPFRGVAGTKEIARAALFRRLEFLAPWKEIRTFVDTSAAYFARKEPTQIAANVSYRSAHNRLHRHTIRHDLEIYRDLGWAEEA